jgi:dihydropteroate synthase
MKANNLRVLYLNNVHAAKEEIEKIDRNAQELKLLTEKAIYRTVKISNLDARAANLLKQEALLVGAEAVISPEVTMFSAVKSDVILLGTMHNYKNLFYTLQNKGFGLESISEEIKATLLRYDQEYPIMKSKKYEFDFSSKTHVMGILNITPDSFSDGGSYISLDEAVKRALEMKAQGADILDIGAESTRPGAKAVSANEELDRIMPILEKLTKEVDIPISVDTYKSEVAAATLSRGACIINDITGLKGDKKMAEVISDNDAIAVIMHMQGTPQNMQKNPEYEDIVGDIILDLRESIVSAQIYGIKNENIIVDPGIGFGKTTSHNLEILKKLQEFKSLGYPVLIGASRKNFIGEILKEKNPLNRLEGSLAVAVHAANNGAAIIRVHDVKETKRALQLVDAIKKNGGQ